MSDSNPKRDALRKDFTAIMENWEKSLAAPKTEFTRDSAILRFELTFEVAWKLLQILVREQGYEANSPRQAFQHAFSIGWITDEVAWDEILRARNNAIRIYREADAEILYGELKRFYAAFADLKKAIS